jgi:3-deoxy-D-manno-octulosonate 8-phosphate phosphatase (KDO 8-P phosphatase)
VTPHAARRTKQVPPRRDGTPPAAAITLLALDADGVLTDGSILLDDDGREVKRFNVRDGFGIDLWHRMGFRVAVITGRSGRALERRVRELAIEFLIQGAADKAAALTRLIEQSGTPADQIAHLADDWPDIPVLRRVGYAMAVADADERVRALARYVTRAPGGRGAVREAVVHLLDAKGLSERALRLYDT